MCWSCDNPTATEADYLELVREKIDSYGVFLQHVEKDRWRPPFTYTVGLTEVGHPELLVTGLSATKAGRFLNAVAHGLLAHGAEALVPGQVHVPDDGPAVEVVDVAEPTVHLLTAVATYGPALRAVQLVYADDRGRWPWQVGFRGYQPVLGPLAETRPAQ